MIITDNLLNAPEFTPPSTTTIYLNPVELKYHEIIIEPHPYFALGMVLFSWCHLLNDHHIKCYRPMRNNQILVSSGHRMLFQYMSLKVSTFLA